MCCTYDAPLVRRWTIHQHLVGIIDARRNTADSLVVLAAFITFDTVRDTYDTRE